MEKHAAIESANFELKKAGMPTYSELQAALNELAVFIEHGVNLDSIKESADRARKLATAA